MENAPLNPFSVPEHPVFPSPLGPKSFGSKALRKKWIPLAAAIASVLILIEIFFIAPPRRFQTDRIVTVEKGETLSGFAESLKKDQVIRSPFAFKVLLTLFGSSKGLIAGDYLMERKQNVISLSWRLSHGIYNLKDIRITVPEGLTSWEIADLIESRETFSKFNKDEFLALASRQEGYLFPDTYFFLPNVTGKDVAEAMLKNFDVQIETLSADLTKYGRPLKDVVKMASIIEEEARTEESRRMIAGILWKRFDEGMLLQVDAAFAFVNGKKDSRLLTLDDLKINSPYNTYVTKGLPPTPITNPGLHAIKATINPIKSDYYFYLSDMEGNMHYAKTHDGHVANKEKYLR